MGGVAQAAGANAEGRAANERCLFGRYRAAVVK
jgi:hypothetical protein